MQFDHHWCIPSNFTGASSDRIKLCKNKIGVDLAFIHKYAAKESKITILMTENIKLTLCTYI